MYPYDNNDLRNNSPSTPEESPVPTNEPDEEASPSASDSEASTPTISNEETSGWHSPSSSEPSSGFPSVDADGTSSPSDGPSYPSTSYHYSAGHTYDPYGWHQPTPPAPEPPKKKKKKNGATIALAALAVVCAATIVTLSVMLGFALNQQTPSVDNTGGSSSPSSSNTAAATGEKGDSPALQISETDEDAQALSTQEIIQKNLDSTVIITTYEQVNSYNPFLTGTTKEDGDTPGLTQASSATGIVMTADGYIITNRHCVINEETNIQYAQIDVKTYSGDVYEKATVVGVDSDTDLAVIKVDATDLTPAEFGDSSALELGDKVVALGNSGGLEWTPTQGIISGLARDVYDDTGYSIKCLQTDAAINPGNSGGPLINSAGQVIGINSAKIVASGYENLGFSIPINEAKPIIDSLIEYGYVKGRVSLGITGSSYTSTNTNYNGFQILSIGSDSSLANTDAEVGDIITHVDDVRVSDYAELRTQLSAHQVGDEVTLTLLHVNTRTRQIETIKVTCTLQESTGE